MYLFNLCIWLQFIINPSYILDQSGIWQAVILVLTGYVLHKYNIQKEVCNFPDA